MNISRKNGKFNTLFFSLLEPTRLLLFKASRVSTLMILLFRTLMDEDPGKICTSSGMKKNRSTFIWYFRLNSFVPRYSIKSFFFMIESASTVPYLVIPELLLLYRGSSKKARILFLRKIPFMGISIEIPKEGISSFSCSLSYCKGMMNLFLRLFANK